MVMALRYVTDKSLPRRKQILLLLTTIARELIHERWYP